MKRSLALAACLLLVTTSLSAAGCGATSSGAQATMTYQDQVEAAFARAEQSFEKRDYLEAMRRYNLVRNQFPYSRFAPLSDLRIADAYFAQEQFASAIEQYRAFVQMHPNHEKTVYAFYRIALSFYEQMPSDFFLLPPSHEKDLSRARDAARELRLFVRHYPDSEHTADANRKLAQVRRRLADHEFYVATYYLERDNYRAAANRLTYLLSNYSGVGLDPQALFLLGRSYLELGEVERAVTALEDLVEVHPNHELARRAKGYLDEHRPQ